LHTDINAVAKLLNETDRRKVLDEKTLSTLEFHKILEQLAHHTTFSVGRERALAVCPVTDIEEAERLQAETEEARMLFDLHGDLSLGGAHDVRPLIENALKNVPLTPEELLDIRSTLLRAGEVRRTLTRLGPEFPNLTHLGRQIDPCSHVSEEIGKSIDDRGEVRDNATPELARIRREERIAHSRLMNALQKIVSSTENQKYLQEPIITQRHGRYVVPLKAEFKGRIPGLVHDQSASGATLFIEPLATVELNNRWRELQLDEAREIRRILSELTLLVAEESVYIEGAVNLLGELDLILARARYAEQLNAVRPKLLDFQRSRRLKNRDGETTEIHHPGSVINLPRARHPLLPPESVVPIDVHIGKDFFILVITGPNTGGKTVSLKTTGLLALMAQSGMQIPTAEGAELTVFDGIYADIGDEQSIEQNLSTFSSHMGQIIRILKNADSRSLVLLDELGAGTDPEEGSALARAILSHLLARGITTFATTHYSELKVYAHVTPGIENASVEFDPETLSPTYELTIGLPGRSNALYIASRLGLDEEIVAAAKAMVRPESRETESLLLDLKEARVAAQSARIELERERTEVERLRRELTEKLARIEEARRLVLMEAREEADAEIEEVRREIKKLRQRLKSLQPGLHQQMLKEAEKALEKLSKEEIPEAPVTVESAEEPQEGMYEFVVGPLKPGDRVFVTTLQADGEVVSAGAEDALVQVGAFRIRVPLERLERKGKPVAVKKEQEPEFLEPSVERPPMEIDLRGQTVDEALPKVEKYLDQAYLARLPWVRIIHGKGTGALRQAIRKYLSDHPLVATFRSGEESEGGNGVTVVKFIEEK
jgi:DNA mismatch repair protein MutS2